MKQIQDTVYICEKCGFKSITAEEMSQHERKCDELRIKKDKSDIRKKIYNSLYIEEINLLINEYIKQFGLDLCESTKHFTITMKTDYNIIPEFSHYKLKAIFDVHHMKIVQKLMEICRDADARYQFNQYLTKFEDYNFYKNAISESKKEIKNHQTSIEKYEKEMYKIHLDVLVKNLQKK